MTIPALYIPALGSNPVGWAILGAAGYLTYCAGKKAGSNKESLELKESIGDRTVKGAMKTAYKAQQKVSTTISAAKEKVSESTASTKDKYSAMWDEAQNEVKAES